MLAISLHLSEQWLVLVERSRVVEREPDMRNVPGYRSSGLPSNYQTIIDCTVTHFVVMQKNCLHQLQYVSDMTGVKISSSLKMYYDFSNSNSIDIQMLEIYYKKHFLTKKNN